MMKVFSPQNSRKANSTDDAPNNYRKLLINCAVGYIDFSEFSHNIQGINRKDIQLAHASLAILASVKQISSISLNTSVNIELILKVLVILVNQNKRLISKVR